jgi:hypothetical protein
MKTPLRILFAAALLAPALAPAQTMTTTVLGVPASLQVSRLGPQLIGFVGGQANFDSLVNGLALGTPVSLTTPLPNGQVQLVSFTPQGTMTPTQIAQTLESARQNLISRGIAVPSGQQVAITLAGGALPTQTGTVPVTALLPAANVPATAAAGATGAATPVTVATTAANPNGTPSPAALIQGQSGAGGTTPPSPATIIQNQRDGNISNTPTAGNVSNTPSATPGTGTVTPGAATQTAPLAPTPAPRGASPFAPPPAR